MSDTIKNKIATKYEFDGETYEDEAECELSAIAPVRPELKICKNGSPDGVKIGETATYYVVVTIADGDDAYGIVSLIDTPDDNMAFVVGTLKIDGVVAENQDISDIQVAYHPNTVISIEYQCLRIS